jgi:hypothetical protein
MTQMRIMRLPAASEQDSFFVKIHKSIVTPAFYVDVRFFSFGRAVLFFVQMCVITALICGGSATYFALNKEKGLPTQISQMLPGMSIQNGVLNPGRATPYIPEQWAVSSVFNTLSTLPGFFDSVSTSFLIVDTSSAQLPKPSAFPSIVLGARQITIRTDSLHAIPFSYGFITSNIVFTPDGVHAFLMHNVVSMLINFCFQTGVVNSFIFFVSCIFLAFAAYIFRADKRFRFTGFIKTACFAITPVFIGTNCIALSGMTINSAWEILIIIATVLMFRGVRAQMLASVAGKSIPPEPKE